MREIKFRAIGKRSNEMIYGIPFFNSLGDWSTRVSIELETLGQYTGLKDKNGKEIYEGDIIKTPNDDWGIIVFTPPFFEVTVSADQSSTYSREFLAASQVIGNIHQNPELIKYPLETATKQL